MTAPFWIVTRLPSTTRSRIATMGVEDAIVADDARRAR